MLTGRAEPLRPIAGRTALIAVGGLMMGLCACEQSLDSREFVNRPGPRPGPGCIDTDRDGFVSIACGGADCNDSAPYINPAAADGPWSYQSRYVANPEAVRWLSVDVAGNAHWMTKVTDALHSETALALRYTHAEGVSFGIPTLVDASDTSGAQVQLWIDQNCNGTDGS